MATDNPKMHNSEISKILGEEGKRNASSLVYFASDGVYTTVVRFCASLFLSVVTLYFLSALFFRRVGCGQNEQLHNIECFTLLFFSFVLLLRASGARWKKLSEEEKSPFKEEARKLRHTHMQVKGVRNFVIKFEALLCLASERKHSRGVIGSRLFSLSVARFLWIAGSRGLRR